MAKEGKIKHAKFESKKKKRRMPTRDELTRIGVDKFGKSIHLKKPARSSSKKSLNQK